MRGLERFAARKTILAEFDSLGLLLKLKAHKLTVPHSDCGGMVIELILTDQRYVCPVRLPKVAVATVEQGESQCVPKQYENRYFNWMQDI